MFGQLKILVLCSQLHFNIDFDWVEMIDDLIIEPYDLPNRLNQDMFELFTRNTTITY